MDAGVIDVEGLGPNETMSVTPDMFYHHLPSGLDFDYETLHNEFEDLLKEVKVAALDVQPTPQDPPIAHVTLRTPRVVPSGGPKAVRIRIVTQKGPASHTKDSRRTYLFEPDPHLYEHGVSAETAITTLDGRNNIKLLLKNTSLWTVQLPAKTRIGTLTAMSEVTRYDEVVRRRRKTPPSSPSHTSVGAAATTSTELTPERREQLLPLFRQDGWHVSSSQHTAALEELLLAHHDLFALSYNDPGEIVDTEHIIDTGEHPPIAQRCRRVADRDMDDLYADLQAKLNAGIIEDSESPWASPVVLVRKKGSGDLRLAVDYGKVNSITNKEDYPIPPCVDILTQAGKTGAQIFSTIDLKAGLHQLKIHEDSKEKTAFITPFGLYQYRRLPLGLCNSPGIFQRITNRLIDPLVRRFGPGKISCHIDDILIAATSEEEHLLLLEALFDRLRIMGFRIHPKKCAFLRTEVRHLGHILTSEGIQMDPEMTKAIIDFPRPRTVTALQAFMGMCGSYRHFIANYTAAAHPLLAALRGLPKPPPRLKWTPCMERAFNELKGCLATGPVLKHAVPTQPYVVETDASGIGLGAVIGQFYDASENIADLKDLPTEDILETAKKLNLHPIAFASRALHGQECKYPTYDLEMYAVRFALQVFRSYLKGRKTILLTDSTNVRDMLKNGKELPSSRLERWKLYIMDYDLTAIKHRPGKLNKVADCLSRYPIKGDIVRAMVVDVEPSKIRTVDEWPPRRKPMPLCTAIDIKRDEDIGSQDAWRAQYTDPLGNAIAARLLNHSPSPEGLEQLKTLGPWLDTHISHFSIKDGVLGYQSSEDAPFRPYVPRRHQRQVLDWIHSHPFGGHFEKEKTFAKLSRSFYWPHMKVSSDRFVASCKECQLKRDQGLRYIPPFDDIPRNTRTLDKVTLDLVSMPLTLDGNTNALILTCMLTGYAILKPLPNLTSKVVMSTFLEAVLPYGAIPLQVHTDQEKPVADQFSASLAELLRFENVFASSFQPHSLIPPARHRKDIIDMTIKLGKRRDDDWDKLLPLLAYVSNSLPSGDQDTSPFYRMFGREPRPLCDDVLLTQPHNYTDDHDDFLADLPNRLQLAWKLAEHTVLERRAKANKPAPPVYHVGDWVLIKQPSSSRHLHPRPPLGPGKIIRLSLDSAPPKADVQIPGKSNTRCVPLARLTPVSAPPEASADHPPPDTLIPDPAHMQGQPPFVPPVPAPAPAPDFQPDPNLDPEASSEEESPAAALSSEPADHTALLLEVPDGAAPEMLVEVSISPGSIQERVLCSPPGEHVPLWRSIDLGEYAIYPTDSPDNIRRKARVLKQFLSPFNYEYYLKQARHNRDCAFLAQGASSKAHHTQQGRTSSPSSVSSSLQPQAPTQDATLASGSEEGKNLAPRPDSPAHPHSTAHGASDTSSDSSTESEIPCGLVDIFSEDDSDMVWDYSTFYSPPPSPAFQAASPLSSESSDWTLPGSLACHSSPGSVMSDGYNRGGSGGGAAGGSGGKGGRGQQPHPQTRQGQQPPQQQYPPAQGQQPPHQQLPPAQGQQPQPQQPPAGNPPYDQGTQYTYAQSYQQMAAPPGVRPQAYAAAPGAGTFQAPWPPFQPSAAGPWSSQPPQAHIYHQGDTFGGPAGLQQAGLSSYGQPTYQSPPPDAHPQRGRTHEAQGHQRSLSSPPDRHLQPPAGPVYAAPTRTVQVLPGNVHPALAHRPLLPHPLSGPSPPDGDRRTLSQPRRRPPLHPRGQAPGIPSAGPG